jgi:hypothetical protein
VATALGMELGTGLKNFLSQNGGLGVPDGSGDAGEDVKDEAKDHRRTARSRKR